MSKSPSIANEPSWCFEEKEEKITRNHSNPKDEDAHSEDFFEHELYNDNLDQVSKFLYVFFK